MNWKNTSSRYGTVSMTLHWLTVLVLIGVYACINLTDLFAKGSAPREALKDGHFMLGLAVLALMAPRLFNRILGKTPAVVPPMPRWQQWLASAMHVTLYVFLVAMPLLGWLTLSASGKPIPFFGIQLPALLAENKDLGKQLKEVHEALGTLGYFLVGAHAFAALFHHFITRDNTLIRMWPQRR
ncbi:MULTISPECIES: cytochrome b [Hydrogenophaga]|uniref:cytochrome b n=1 Tax=Hydrogenophaga TaxID=47420 RepID=UPI000877FBAB|nr:MULTISPECIES: cytochrome b [unclassified Hydrogenophaga]MBN9370967.1 cytochrome b [Hydrogenophaga sp.]OJV63376.1 MAG: cytochrome B [Hydrogenophaga sp. 70-12]